MPCPWIAAAFLYAMVGAQEPPPADHVTVELPPTVEFDDAEAAGLPRGSRPPVLTWERVYALALLRAREGGKPAPLDALDPKALDERARAAGVLEFGRFRKEFLAAGAAGSAFHDPAPAVFDLLRRRQAVVSAWQNVQALEQLKAVYTLVKGANAMPGPKRVDEALGRWRPRLGKEQEGYRAALGALKVELGLSPRAPAVVDGSSVAAFRRGFDAVDEWQKDPDRDPEELPRIVSRLPRLADVVIDAGSGRSLLKSPTRFTPALVDDLAAVAARAGGGGGGAARRQQFRHLLGQMLDLHRAYEADRARLWYAVRGKDEAFEKLMAPPPADGKPVKAMNLLKLHEQILEAEARLVASWAGYQTRRLLLYRGLGSLPFDDWASFAAALSAGPRPGGAGPPPPGPGANPPVR